MIPKEVLHDTNYRGGIFSSFGNKVQKDNTFLTVSVVLRMFSCWKKNDATYSHRTYYHIFIRYTPCDIYYFRSSC